MTYARRLGVKTDELLISQPDHGEQALEIADMLVRSGAVDLVVIDSVAALSPRPNSKAQWAKRRSAGTPALMSHALRKLTGTIHKSRTAVIFINQIRMKIGVTGYGSPKRPPAATRSSSTPPCASTSARSRPSRTGRSLRLPYPREGGQNKMAPPFREAKFDIIWGTGISAPGTHIDLGVDAGIVDKSGHGSPSGPKSSARTEKVRALLDETPELRNAIESQLIEHLGMNPRPVVRTEETLPDPRKRPRRRHGRRNLIRCGRAPPAEPFRRRCRRAWPHPRSLHLPQEPVC